MLSHGSEDRAMGSRFGSGRAFLSALLTLLPLAAAANAGTLNVPAEYPTIQAAIVAAQPGDTVLVAPGTYVETIDFLGKAISVESSGGAAVTTIDGNRGGSVVSFVSGEPAATTLRGFTITGGTGSLWLNGSSQWIIGGGIRIVGASPGIANCVITHNTAADYGGGIGVVNGDPLIEHCTIASNSTTIAGGGGAGFNNDWFSGSELHDCTLSANTSAGGGGGFRSGQRSVLRMYDCLIENNQAAGGGGGSFSFDSDGFVVFEMEDCTFAGNRTPGWGGGLSTSMYGDFLPPAGWLRRCLFTDNFAARGGALYAYGGFIGGSVGLRDCLLLSNSATEYGGAVASWKGVGLQTCTIVGNSAPTGGAWYSEYPTSYGPWDCILWGNSPDQLAGAVFQPQWSDIQGGYAGTGNIDVDPHFVDAAGGDYHLAPTSACVDAADPLWLGVGEIDIDGDPRVLFGRMDIGADEATFAAGPWTFLGHALAGEGDAPTLVGSGTLVGGTPMTLALSGAAPSQPCWIVAGASQLLLPFKGGVIVPAIDQLIGPIGTRLTGGFTLGGTWPASLPSGFVVYLQAWISDPSGPVGFTATNGLAAKTQ